MPDAPDLEIVQEILQRCVVGATIERVVVRQPLVIRALGGADFATALQGQRIVAVSRRGKNLVFQLAPDGWLVITPMLAGRLHYVPRSESRKRKPAVTFDLDRGMALVYSDPRKMGKVYLTHDLALLPRWNELGPEALDPALTLDAFRERLRGRKEEIKRVLTNQSVVAGIGNAYADEICWRAGLSPFRSVAEITEDDLARLYAAMRAVLSEAIIQLRERMGDDGIAAMPPSCAISWPSTAKAASHARAVARRSPRSRPTRR